MLEFRISEDDTGLRLDKFLRRTLPNVPTSHLFKMIRVKKVRVNGRRGQPEQHLAKDDVVTIRGDAQALRQEREHTPPPPPEVDLSALKVLLEDEWLLVIDKPSGMAVHTGSGITGGTVVDLVRAYLGPKAERNGFSASPAHRIDRETSGVLVVAKRRPAMVHFTDVFTRHLARKQYLALVKGRLPQRTGLIDLPLPEHQQTAESRARRGVNLQEARTRYTVLGQTSEVAFVSCTIETGRTHQIRRHFAAIGHPVVGDAKHGDFAFNRDVKARWGLSRLFLHSTRLEFPHPKGQARTTVAAPLPPELAEVLARAGLALPGPEQAPGARPRVALTPGGDAAARADVERGSS
ncbi:MAG: RluA family pseudouridine synthase [Myxococcaceae bacterium]|nr:RluA family pseudouridine synthase [Myxococcaceae bacterium]MCA3016961.1 RluA family pseudouridine synthase [Myxococcaceae bacterium]